MAERGHGFILSRRGVALGILSFLGLLVITVGLAVTHPKVAPRIRLVVEKLSGERPDDSWGDLAREMLPSGLKDRENPYLSTRNPYASGEEVAAGAETFRSQCALCHRTDGSGDVGADLTTGTFRHGSSDLGLFETIQQGVPGTAMQGFPLSDRQIWQLVAFIRTLASTGEGNPAGSPPALAGPDLSYGRLREARGEPRNWLTYAGAYDSKRYSPLESIRAENVESLGIRWVHQLATIYTRVESSPLVVDGVMYVTGPNGSALALDGGSGEPLWRFERNPNGKLPLCCGRVNRGAALLGDSLFLGTLDARLISLDARSGALQWDVVVEDYRQGYSITVAPLALDGKVIVGVSGGEYGIRGFIDAYDAKTGARLWRRHTIPGPGEPHHETWEGDSWKTGGAPTWVTGSFDPELGLLYWGVGNPGPVYSSEGREGDNLYSNAVLALDPQDGGIRWFFQFTPGDTHDWDANQTPVLADLDWEGESRKLMLWANRNGFFYVLDRATGELLLAEPFARQSWAEGIDENGRPIEKPGVEPTAEGTIVFPGAAGATNWWSPSFSPRTGLLYVPVLDWGSIYFSGEEAEPAPGELFLGSTWSHLPLEEGRMLVRAIVPGTGRAKWEYEMPGGLNRDLRLSRRLGGLLSTGGDLVFGANRSRFVALDARGGEELWGQELGGQIVAAPVSYEIDGVQYVAVSAGRSIFAFSLRDPRPRDSD